MDARRAVLRVPTARQLYGVRGVNGREQESLERRFFTSIRLKNGTYKTTGGFTSNAAGTYRWTATYGGDSNNESVASGCDDEKVTVTSRRLRRATRRRPR